MSIEEAKDLLILIYIEIKFRKNNELLLINEEILKKEQQSLRKYSIFTITKYIYDYINILVDSKAEKDLREHIKLEEQLKIRVEELEFELDDFKSGKIKNNNTTYKTILTMTNGSEKKNKNNKKLMHKKNERYSKKLLQNISNNIFNIIDNSNSKNKQNIMHKPKYSRILSIKKKHLSHKSNILLSNNYYIFSNNNTNSNISEKNSFLKFKSLINSTKKNKEALKRISTESISISYINNKNPKLIKHCNKLRKRPNLTNLINNKINASNIINSLKIKYKKISNFPSNSINNNNRKNSIQKTFQKFYNPSKMKNIINMKKKINDKRSKTHSKCKYNACKTERMEDSSQNLDNKVKNNKIITQNNTCCKTSMISEDILGPFLTGGNISKIGNSKEKSSTKKSLNNMKLKKKLIYGRLIKKKKSFRSNTNYLLTEYSIKKIDK